MAGDRMMEDRVRNGVFPDVRDAGRMAAAFFCSRSGTWCRLQVGSRTTSWVGRLSRVLALRSTDWRTRVGGLALGYINIHINTYYYFVPYLVALAAG